MFIIRMHQFMSSARFYRPTTSIEMMWPFQDSASSSRIHQMKNGNMLKNWWNTKIREEGVSFSKTSKYVCPLWCLRKLRLQYTFRNCAFVAFSVFKGFILYFFCLFAETRPWWVGHRLGRHAGGATTGEDCEPVSAWPSQGRWQSQGCAGKTCHFLLLNMLSKWTILLRF